MAWRTGFLIRLQQHENSLTLRLELLSDEELSLGENGTVISLTLVDCDELGQVTNRLEQLLETTFNFEVSIVGENALLSLIDLEDEQHDIICQAVQEADSVYLISELYEHRQKLREQLQQAMHLEWVISRRYDQFIHRLKVEIGKELDRQQRKTDFFVQNQPDKATIAYAKATTYEKMLGLIARLKTEEQGVADEVNTHL